MAIVELSYVALSKSSFLAPLDYELHGSLMSELWAFVESSYVALSKSSFLAPLDSKLSGSLEL